MLKEKKREKLGKGAVVDLSRNCKIPEFFITVNYHELLPLRRPAKEKQGARVSKDCTLALGRHEFGTRQLYPLRGK